jgi:hypothetical protein
MPSPHSGRGGSITVASSAALPLTVSISRTDGGTLTVYTDAACATSVTMPDAITDTKTYYVNSDNTYTVSVLFNGIEVNGAATYVLKNGASVTVAPTVNGLGTVSVDSAGVSTSIMPILTKTGNYTIAYTAASPQTSDLGRNIEIDSTSAVVVTIPTNATAPFPIGGQVSVSRINTGTVTIQPASGVTLNYYSPTSTTNAAAISQRWSAVSLLKRGTNSWQVLGPIT